MCKELEDKQHFYAFRNKVRVFYVEDLGGKIKVFLSSRMQLEESLNHLLPLPHYSLFLKKSRVDHGVVHLAKIHSSKDWFVECVIWPSSGERKNIHIHLGSGKEGLLLFKGMIKSRLISSSPGQNQEG